MDKYNARGIAPDCLKLGSFLEWENKSFASRLLARLILLFDREARDLKWDAWGWHLSVIVGWSRVDGWIIGEASGKGNRTIPLRSCTGNYRVWNWFSRRIDQGMMNFFVDCKLDGGGYDFLSYLYTAMYVLSGKRLPRMLDHHDNCWEYAFDCACHFGKPFCSAWRMPYIIDFHRAVSRSGPVNLNEGNPNNEP